ncbi:rhomboid family intramembrane serine protease [Hymenobacter gummosus]|uniref:Rhomboid family intramembrane serine protease n=1 Tax=Hymenobacter gummosus TaxID=1776032 RepID=A0A431TXS3_9BACT|nr:rhomboid family intramembrane serine protease [Hymenobacter gummosus]RTQ46280.1 rhomboid family intramembrane serine protease [Hymenobacter gummosus]
MARSPALPSYTLPVPLGPLTPEQALMLALDVAQGLRWPLRHLSAAGLVVQRNPASATEPPALVTVRLAADELLVNSSAVPKELAGTRAQQQAYAGEFARAYQGLAAVADAAELQRRYEQARADFPPPDKDVLVPRPTAAQSVLDAFRPRRGYVVTPVLISLNVLIYLLMVANGAGPLLPDPDIMVRWGANVRPLTLGGEWWRLLTACFLHFGALHLLLNMFALRNIGEELEQGIGSVRLLAGYLLAGLGASLVSLWWHEQPVVSAGASGAIFGLFGLLLALITTTLVDAKVRKPLLASLGSFIGYNLLFGLVPGIDNAAHIGGLLTGMVVGYALFLTLRRGAPKWMLPLVLGLLGLGMAGAIAGALRLLPRAADRAATAYEAGLTEFQRREQRAEQLLATLRQSTTISREEALRRLQTEGLDGWRQNLQLVQRLDSLELPTAEHQRLLLLRQYSRYQVRRFRLLHRALAENSSAYSDSVRVYQQQAERLVDALNKMDAASGQ